MQQERREWERKRNDHWKSDGINWRMVTKAIGEGMTTGGGKRWKLGGKEEKKGSGPKSFWTRQERRNEDKKKRLANGDGNDQQTDRKTTKGQQPAASVARKGDFEVCHFIITKKKKKKKNIFQICLVDIFMRTALCFYLSGLSAESSVWFCSATSLAQESQIHALTTVV